MILSKNVNDEERELFRKLSINGSNNRELSEELVELIQRVYGPIRRLVPINVHYDFREFYKGISSAWPNAYYEFLALKHPKRCWHEPEECFHERQQEFMRENLQGRSALYMRDVIIRTFYLEREIEGIGFVNIGDNFVDDESDGSVI